MAIEVESPEQLGYDVIANNLSESSVADRRWRDLGIDVDVESLLLCYGDHLGAPVLRDAVASDADGITADDVLVTPGAAAALFCLATSVLDAGSHVVVVRSNYATNLETPRAIGADVEAIDLTFDTGWRLDLDRIAAAVEPGRTKLISVTCPHNPTGTMFDLESLHALIDLAERADCFLLVDETYRDLTYGSRLPRAASLSPRAISVCSLSKAYGLPGLRVGWTICRDRSLAETLLAAKEQMVICGPIIDETLGGLVLAARDRVLPPILASARAHLDIVREWVNGNELFEWVEPSGGVVGLVRFRDGIEVDTDRFYKVLLDEFGTYVGPGHWFELDDRYFRLGFGWPTADELRAGLDGLVQAGVNSSAR